MVLRVDKDKSGGNEGVVSGLVESVHAQMQVVLKQHEVNHNEASHGNVEPENERHLKFKNCNVVVLNSEMQKDMQFRKKDIFRVLRYKLGHFGLSSEWDLYKGRWDPPPKEQCHKFK